MKTKATNTFQQKKITDPKLQSLWTEIKNKEKELANKKVLKDKKQLEILSSFLNNHQINSQTGYIESTWNKKTDFVSCGPKVIK